jgi:hypothetical protein
MICGKDGGAKMGLENFVGYTVEFRWTPKPAGRSKHLFDKTIKQHGLSQGSLEQAGAGTMKLTDFARLETP